MVTDLAEVRRLGETKQAENLDFRRYLSAHHHPDEPFHTLAREIERQIDCTACANCCRHSVVTVSPAEIGAIASYLNMEPAEAARLYTEPDPGEPGKRILRSDTNGCVFLAGNLCMVYEARPRPCRDFPHVAREERSLGGRMSSVCRWAPLCPIVYNALEEYKKLTGYRPPAAPG